MKFLDRKDELGRLVGLMRPGDGHLAVVYGRRRLGKTRLLLEWLRRYQGIYSLADQSAAEIQRHHVAQAIEQQMPGFAGVRYPDWGSLLARVGREVAGASRRLALVLDEFPYLVASCPELPSIVQRWVDLELRSLPMAVALAGSSQRMMRGLVLDESEPLYGRAAEILRVRPLAPGYLREAFPRQDAHTLVKHYAAWGGVPRYWELAVGVRQTVEQSIDRLVLDPLGPLHEEPTRLLLQELPTAVEARPVLDAIGLGAHRLSEIAGRIGRPATSLGGAIRRLTEMGLVRREVPFGQSEKQSKRSIYLIDDPLTRLWFRVVAPNRAALAASPPAIRRAILLQGWSHLVAAAWEDLCRQRLPFLSARSALGRLGPWKPGVRWWQASRPEWDIVAESVDGTRLLLAEAKWQTKPAGQRRIAQWAADLRRKDMPVLGRRFAQHDVVKALFVASAPGGAREAPDGVTLVTAEDIIAVPAG